MLSAERHTAIVEMLRQRGRVVANDLSAELGVSADTIRRDLRELDEMGLLRRVHGGALPRTGDMASFAARAHRAPEAKMSIARRAAELIKDGQVVILDGGTTAVEFARALRPDLRATVVTTSPPAAVALSEHGGVNIAVIGGTLRHDALVTVGSEAVDALRMIRADVVILGVCAVHPELGVTTDDLEEAHVKRAMIDGAAAVVALADHDKLGTARSVFVAPIDVITMLITDSGVEDQSLEPYRTAGIEVLYA
jgi:DeoR/GlpR family transcriptional regulator of sugar metabolism